MAVVSIFTLYLTGPCRQQVLQGPKTVLDPVLPLPCPDKPWPPDGRVKAHQVKLIDTGLINPDDGHRAIGRTGSLQPRIAHPRHLLALAPEPIAVPLQVVAVDLSPIG
jgi:hypothetical protein